ncbi:MAG: hypothetical protein IJF33_00095, partial [Clostridia bacterium]|nr:hypothetical protein [Clostridia bacterium]
MGKLLDKNNATFRCYGNIPQAEYFVSPCALYVIDMMRENWGVLSSLCEIVEQLFVKLFHH